MKNSVWIFRIISAFFLAFSAVICLWAYKRGLFSNQKELENFIQSFGVWADIIFCLFQSIQVVFPIIPGGISCFAGVAIFGALKGFILNYLGICTGSVLAFIIAKAFGRPLLLSVFGEKKVTRYENRLINANFTKLFAFLIFIPVAPDDFLCYLAGTTKMNLKTFALIIFTLKPFSISVYSLLLTGIFNFFTN